MATRPLILGLVTAALAASAVGVASRLPVAQPHPYDLVAIPSSAAARWTSLGHPTLVANLWWLRVVQYMGDDRADARGWEKLFPAVNLVTDLDPNHGYAYQVAGIMLGVAGRVQESNALFEKGFANIPDRYSLPFQRAVNAFLYQGDYAEAGRWFEVAGRCPGAPAARMHAYAAAMLAKGDRYDAAVSLLQDSIRAAEDEKTRDSLREQLRQVELERSADLVERAARRYHQLHGFPPPILQVLVFEGFLPELPPDPFGGTLFLSADGRVRSTVHEHRFDRPLAEPRPDEPAPLPPMATIGTEGEAR